ncbi:hypothetical protein JCGZ_02773 [Jatropha curcas]|uniref:Uncharacterized protein n=1 Tax=Jatropha curcas TaxID=180498 RepID=A0A067KXT1_JATCU|nr:hypothetical protein JCGZ_02773 [Jatropha curcas]
MEKATAIGAREVDRTGNSADKLMPTPPNVSTLYPQVATVLTQAYNDFAVVLQRIMAKLVSHIPPEGESTS